MILFRNDALQRAFQRDGYAVFDLLTDRDLREAKRIYRVFGQRYPAPHDVPVYSSCDTFDTDMIRQLDQDLRVLVEPQLNHVLKSYDYLMSSFLTKEPGENNMTPYHQDPTLIERGESPNVSAGLWVPLDDTDIQNGCLRVIPGSHRLGKILVVTPDFPTIFRDFSHKLDSFAEPIVLRAGQGVLFDNKLIHGAYANRSDNSRTALVSAIKSKYCEWHYYYLPQDEVGAMVEKYAMTHEGYVNHRKGMRPNGTLEERFHHSFVSMSEREFLRFMFTNYPIRTVKSMFSSIQSH